MLFFLFYHGISGKSVAKATLYCRGRVALTMPGNPGTIDFEKTEKNFENRETF
ncbi:hypothetical protein JCM17042A_16760 [Ruminococcus champanellensis 18P13 = JCM 17042]